MRYVLKYIIILIVIVVMIMVALLMFNRKDYMEQAVQTSAQMGFNIQEIDLYGRQNTTVDSITNIVDMSRGYPIFKVDVAEVQERLMKLAWVKQAIVKRQLPDKMIIDIKEHKPIAIWQNKGEHYVISNEGKILTVSTKNFKDLPVVVGLNAASGTPLLLSYIDSHFPEIKNRIKSIVWEGDRRWNIVLDDMQRGIEIKLPEDTPNVALQELANIQSQSDLLNKGVSGIDMRMPDKIMIKFQSQDNKNKRRNS